MVTINLSQKDTDRRNKGTNFDGKGFWHDFILRSAAFRADKDISLILCSLQQQHQLSMQTLLTVLKQNCCIGGSETPLHGHRHELSTNIVFAYHAGGTTCIYPLM